MFFGVNAYSMSKIIYWIARFYVEYKMKWIYSPEKAQEKVFHNLINRAKNTQFGKAHHFQAIQNYAAYKKKCASALLRRFHSLYRPNFTW